MTSCAVRDGLLLTESGPLRGDLLVEDGVIVSVGPRVDHSVPKEVDASGALVVPGAVRTDVHLGGPKPASVADDIADLLLAGTTTFLAACCPVDVDQAFEAAAQLGVRAVLGPQLADRPGADCDLGFEGAGWHDLIRDVHRWHGAAAGRLRVAVCLRTPDALTPRTWADVLDLAIRIDAVVHIHLEGGATATGQIARLARLGALTRRTVLAHRRALLRGDCRALAVAGVATVPCSEGAPPPSPPLTPTMRAAAGAVGLGRRFGALRPGAVGDVVVIDGALVEAGHGRSGAPLPRLSAPVDGVRTVLVGGRVLVDDGAVIHLRT